MLIKFRSETVVEANGARRRFAAGATKDLPADVAVAQISAGRADPVKTAPAKRARKGAARKGAARK